MFTPWPEIDALYVVRRTLTYLSLLEENPQPIPEVVTYIGKTKLDGTNSSIRLEQGQVFYQSRNRDITPGDDNFGFAAWASGFKDYWSQFGLLDVTVTIFGEWAGQGVIGGTAIAESPRVFCVFAVQAGDRVYTDPMFISLLLKSDGPANMHVIPWLSAVDIHFGDETKLTEEAAFINIQVAAIEVEDPFAKSLGYSGVGEGLVFYPKPNCDGWTSITDLKTLLFKAKGEKHRVKAAKTSVEINPSVLATANEFVTTFVTDARCQQALRVACGGDASPKNTGAFLKWMLADIEKESKAEVETNSLEFKMLSGPIQNAARQWFKNASQA